MKVDIYLLHLDSLSFRPDKEGIKTHFCGRLRRVRFSLNRDSIKKGLRSSQSKWLFSKLFESDLIKKGLRQTEESLINILLPV